MADLDKKELEHVLNQLVEKLVRQGLLPPNNPELVKKVSAAIMTAAEKNELSLTTSDLKNPDPSTIHALSLACMAERNPDNKFNYTMLFSNKDTDDMKDEIKNVFSEMLKLKFKGKSISEKELQEKMIQLDNMADAIAKTMHNRFKKDDMVCKNNDIMNILGGMLFNTSHWKNPVNEANAVRYGGFDPSVGGSVGSVVQAIPFGDQIGTLDLDHSLSSETFMAQKDNPFTADPIGFKLDELISTLATNPIDTPMEEQLVDSGVIPNIPGRPRLTQHGNSNE